MPDMTKVTLDTVAKGGAPELFEHALEEVLANIQDQNTDAKAKRSITMTFTFAPMEDREMVATALQVKTKLAPVAAVVSRIYVSPFDGVLEATTEDPRQLDAFQDQGVIPMKKEGTTDAD
jgi:hypothetical protein